MLSRAACNAALVRKPASSGLFALVALVLDFYFPLKLNRPTRRIIEFDSSTDYFAEACGMVKRRSETAHAVALMAVEL